MFTIIDIETTGFRKYDSNNVLIPDLLEFGYINVGNDLKIINSGTLYFYEDWFDIENDAQKVHKLTRAFLKEHAKDNVSNAAAMQAMLTNTIIVGKNSDGFDIPFIKSWIKKMFGQDMDINHTTSKLMMKGYYGGYVFHSNESTTLDLQKVYSKFWREDTGASSSKRGSLSEYVASIPNGFEIVKSIYDDLDKERETGAHGALYDCCMTYLVLVNYIIKNGGL